jgi:hypothetical protein
MSEEPPNSEPPLEQPGTVGGNEAEPAPAASRLLRLAPALIGIVSALLVILAVRSCDTPGADRAQPEEAVAEAQGGGPGSGSAEFGDGTLEVVGIVLLPDGTPAAGATVKVTTLIDDRRQQTISDVAGLFGLSVDGEGVVVIEAGLEGWGASVVTAEYPMRDLVRLTLRGGRSLRGRVVRDGEGVAFATVHAGAAGLYPQQHTVTGPDGRFELFGLDEGQVELIAVAPGAGTGFGARAWVEPDDEASPLELELAPAPDVLLRLIDKRTRQPVSTGFVTFSEEPLHVLALSESFTAGELRLSHLPPGRSWISARAPGYLPFEGSLTIEGSGGQTIELSPGATISGRVVNEVQVGIEGARLTALVRTPSGAIWQLRRSEFDSIHPMVRPEGTFFWIPTIEYVSRRDGSYIVTGVPEGEVVLVAEREGFAPTLSAAATLGAEQSREGVDLVMMAPRRVRGRVQVAGGGPIAEARLIARPALAPWWWTPPAVRTDSRGFFDLRDLPRSVKLSTVAEGYEPDARVLDLPEEGLDDLLIELQTGRVLRVKGRVFGLRGAAAVGAKVWLLDGSRRMEPVCTAVVDGSGWFETTPCRETPSRILASSALTAPLDAPLRSTQPADWKLPLGGEVEVAVDGAGAAVELTSSSLPTAFWPPQTALLEPWKRVRFSQVAEGTYFLQCRREGSVSERVDLRVFEGRRTEVTCPESTPERTMRVVVVDPQGAPLSGAVVRVGGGAAGRFVITDDRGRAELRIPDGEERTVEAGHPQWGVGSVAVRGAADAEPARLQIRASVPESIAGSMRQRLEAAGVRTTPYGRSLLVEALVPQSPAAGSGLARLDPLLWCEPLDDSTLLVTVWRRDGVQRFRLRDTHPRSP